MEGDEFAPLVGAVALAQAEIDEWLVQVLIALLKPLSPSRVELLVGGRSLGEKVDLVKSLSRGEGLDLQQPLPDGVVPKELLGRVRQLDTERNRAVHSYYDRRDGDRARQFRSRRGSVEAVAISELQSLRTQQEQCLQDLNQFVEILEQSTDSHDALGATWSEVVRGVHEVIVAGHLAERGLLPGIVDSVERGGSLRVALRRVSRRLLEQDESPSADEHVAEISTATWLSQITSPDGREISFGDTGWRDVTAIAQEEDPEVKWAAVRRVGGTVLCSFEGGESATTPWPMPRNRLAERAFGPQQDPGLGVPGWVLGLEGFRPDSTNQ